jgi:EmrB/QacA subfamily drug resistance transporter
MKGTFVTAASPTTLVSRPMPPGHPTAHPTAVLVLVLATYLMIIVDTSVVITGLPDIQADLDLSATGLSWVQNAYTLAFGGLLLLGARAGDLFGRRRVLITGLVLFTAASLLVGAAPTAPALIAARALQGVGAAILAPSTLALLTAGFPEGPERSRAVAAYGSVAGIGTAFGLVLGGLVADLWSWRAAFALNVPIGILLVVLALRYLPGGRGRPGRLDLAGAVTSTAAMTALVYGLVRSADSGCSDPVTVGTVAAGLVLLAAFLLVERTAMHPIMPLSLFADRVRTGAYLARFCFIGAMITYFLFVSQFLQDVQGWTALQAGLAFLPMTIVNFVVATAVPRLTRWAGASRMMVAGLVLALTGMVLLATGQPNTAFLIGIAVPGVLIGAGQGLLFAHLTAAGISGVRADQAGAASGVVNAFHQIGGALGLGVTITLAAAAAQRSTADDPGTRFTEQVGAALTGSSVLLAIALITVLTLVVRPGRRKASVVAAPIGSREVTATA